jgi:hypothetical protein
MRKTDPESSARPFRAGDRFFRIDGQWYYTLREGDEGPFGSRAEAESHLNTFLQLQTFKDNRKARVEEIKRSERLGDPAIWNRQLDSI